MVFDCCCYWKSNDVDEGCGWVGQLGIREGGCCDDVVLGCDDVCGSGLVDDACGECNGNGVEEACDCVDTSGLNEDGCCDDVVMGCDEVCGSGSYVDV